MTANNSYLVPYDLVPVPPSTSFYPSDARWADPDLDQAARLMRQVVERPDEAAAVGARASRDLEQRHGLDAAAVFVQSRLGAESPPRPEPLDAVERAAWELMWGPDLERARPWMRRLRRPLAPLLRPYLDHQREVAALVLEALRKSRG
jgi:hypothetical protein